MSILGTSTGAHVPSHTPWQPAAQRGELIFARRDGANGGGAAAVSVEVAALDLARLYFFGTMYSKTSRIFESMHLVVQGWGRVHLSATCILQKHFR